MILSIAITLKTSNEIIDYNSQKDKFKLGIKYKVQDNCLQVTVQKQLYKSTCFYPLDTIENFIVEEDNQ